MKISGTPLWDPEIGSPFAILHEPALIKKLPRVQRKASVITGAVAAPFISEILSARGSTAPVIPVKKEIACLITGDDLREIDCALLAPTVIIPGRAFIHDAEAKEILGRDGINRTVIQGPDQLTADAETSMGMNRRDVLEMEIAGLSELIRLINLYGK